VKIKGTCRRDGREFYADQVIASGGECPWDGEPFNADYAVTLVDALRDAKAAGSALELAVDAIADLMPAFTIDRESIFGDLRASLDRLERNVVRRG
jgi:hypothetical protein